MSGMQSPYRRVLVTGAASMTGRALIDALRARGVVVVAGARRLPAFSEKWKTGVEWRIGDLTDGSYCSSVIADVDAVFHTASLRSNGDKHHAEPTRFSSGNVELTLPLLAALRASRRPIVVFSTANIPPGIDPLFLFTKVPLDGYVLGKLLCDLLWMIYARELEEKLLIVRPAGIYGPWDRFTADTNVIPALIMRAETASETLTAWGDGTQRRSFAYVDDIAEATMRLIDAGAEGVQYVVSPTSVCIRELAEIVRDYVKPRLRIQFDVSHALGSQAQQWPELHACLQSMSWVPLSDGIKRTVEWRTEAVCSAKHV